MMLAFATRGLQINWILSSLTVYCSLGTYTQATHGNSDAFRIRYLVVHKPMPATYTCGKTGIIIICIKMLLLELKNKKKNNPAAGIL